MLRDCAECDQVDEFPRHVVGLLNPPKGTPPPRPRHINCCAEKLGCPQCQATMREADNRTGQELADFLAAQRTAALNT